MMNKLNHKKTEYGHICPLIDGKCFWITMREQKTESRHCLLCWDAICSKGLNSILYDKGKTIEHEKKVVCKNRFYDRDLHSHEIDFNLL